jgi:aspartate/methionine/tyrosine aminotransferase
MHTENDTSKPEDSPQQEAGEGCSGATCSASSDTPETDAAIALANDPDGAPEVCDLCEKLERQRNAAWKTLKEIRQLFVDDESFGAIVEALFATPLEEAEAEIARLNSLLNANSPDVGATE